MDEKIFFIWFAVSTSQQNLRALRQLAQGLHEAKICPRSVCWGGPVGSQKLWRHNARAIQRILDTAAQLKIQEVLEIIY